VRLKWNVITAEYAKISGLLYVDVDPLCYRCFGDLNCLHLQGDLEIYNIVRRHYHSALKMVIIEILKTLVLQPTYTAPIPRDRNLTWQLNL
jgi:hypothetical protein